MFKKISSLFLSVCILACITACNLSEFVNIPTDPTKAVINFDLSQYHFHGDLECGLVWVIEETSNWDTEKEYRFAYFDADGNIKSPWFDGTDVNDFCNNYVILEIREGKYIYCVVYDTAFTEVLRTPLIDGYYKFLDFDSEGYAYFRAIHYGDLKDTFYWADANGLHEFEKVSQFDHWTVPSLWDIERTNGYFIILDSYQIDRYPYMSNSIACIFDSNGKLVIDIEEALEKQSNQYKRFIVKSAELVEDNCIEISFYGADDKLYVATMNFDGNFIEEPTLAVS